MTANGLNANTIRVIDEIIKELSVVDMSMPKIFVEPSDALVRTCLHSMVQAVFCYGRRVTLGAYFKESHACKHVDPATGEINCGYVIGYAVYKWLIWGLEPELAIHDVSTGCSFGHDREITKAFQVQVADYLSRMIPDPRRHPCYNGFVKIKNYVWNVFAFYAPTSNRDPVLYQETSKHNFRFKDAVVFDLTKMMRDRNARPERTMMKIILTRDEDIFVKPGEVPKKSDDDDCK